jgi:hypothetical protein
VIGGAMLPIAYLSFLLLMNSRQTLGDSFPTGIKRLIWNILMFSATCVAGFASAWGLYGKAMTIGEQKIPLGNIALGALAVMLVIGVVGFLLKESAHSKQRASET